MATSNGIDASVGPVDDGFNPSPVTDTPKLTHTEEKTVTAAARATPDSPLSDADSAIGSSITGGSPVSALTAKSFEKRVSVIKEHADIEGWESFKELLVELEVPIKEEEAKLKELEKEIKSLKESGAEAGLIAAKEGDAAACKEALAPLKAQLKELRMKISTFKASSILLKMRDKTATRSTQSGLAALSPEYQAEDKASKRTMDALGLDPVKPKKDKELEAKKAKVATIQATVARMPKAEFDAAMTKMHAALAPRMSVVKGPTGFTAVANTGDAASTTRVKGAQAAIVMGSNDIHQVSAFHRNVWSKLTPEEQKDFKIYISGYGGHGTMSGPIFGQTEAATMAKWLVDLGVPAENIEIEPNATNSGQNVQFADEFFRADEYFGEQPPRNIIVSGTPAGCYRQVLSLLKQSEYGGDFETLTLHPTEDPTGDYFDDESKKHIYALSYFRELGSYVAYSVGSQYIAPIPVHHEADLKAGIVETLKFYNKLQPASEQMPDDVCLEEATRIANLFVEFQNEKAALTDNGQKTLTAGEMDALKAKYKDVTDVFGPVNSFFRGAFGDIEAVEMERIPRGLTHAEHSQRLRDLHASKEAKDLMSDAHLPSGAETFTARAPMLENPRDV
ncbi:MAG: hypothetical protein S4CHLAM37_07900 [Chlamydiia bacterium]|nr:hypothetical protein [Chlamydiia bacterium]